MSSLASSHCQQPVVHEGNPLAEQKTRWAVLLTLVMMVAEIGGGWFYNSMALLKPPSTSIFQVPKLNL